jgi:hypothetical protein
MWVMTRALACSKPGALRGVVKSVGIALVGYFCRLKPALLNHVMGTSPVTALLPAPV